MHHVSTCLCSPHLKECFREGGGESEQTFLPPPATEKRPRVPGFLAPHAYTAHLFIEEDEGCWYEEETGGEIDPWAKEDPALRLWRVRTLPCKTFIAERWSEIGECAHIELKREMPLHSKGCVLWTLFNIALGSGSHTTFLSVSENPSSSHKLGIIYCFSFSTCGWSKYYSLHPEQGVRLKWEKWVVCIRKLLNTSKVILTARIIYQSLNNGWQINNRQGLPEKRP